jgi:phage tail-like protein
MRPDRTFFHQLLGKGDWGRCRVDGSSRELSRLWEVDVGSRDPLPPDWDGTRAVLTLPQLRDTLPPTAGETPLALSARRAAAADANGNIYWIGDDLCQLHVHASGKPGTAHFWPDPRAIPPRTSLFAACRPEAPQARRYTGLAITEDAWLVAAFEDQGGPTGFEVFDLIGGGAPTEHRWPTSDRVRALDLAAAPCGGLWLLDDRRRLLAFDRRLEITGPSPEAGLPEIFQPNSGESRTYVPSAGSGAWDLAAIDPAIDPIAIELLSCNVIAILARESDGGRLYMIACNDHALLSTARVDLSPAHDMVLAKALLRDRSQGLRLFITGGAGNQAIAFKVNGEERQTRLEPTNEVFPLRRYGGRALVAVQGAAYHDSGDVPAWVPLVERPVASFETRSDIVTPVFDASVPGTMWDRVRLDGCIPPGTRVVVAARSGDEGLADPELLGEWFVQPSPILNSTGAEFAGYDPAALPATDPAHGKGTWELLLQRMEGRFLQLRLTLQGNRNNSPELRALRAWYPRQSWSERYLPAVYRAEPGPADFLDRFLANMEGTVATIERRIVDAQALLDPRTAPAENLDWLASWFDVALDPAWGEGQRRLFLAHAAHFLSLRGTKRGVEAALALAFTPCADERLFADPSALRTGIRITESFLANSMRALVRSSGTGGTFWSPDDDNVDLAERIAVAMGKEHASEDERADPVPLYPPDSDADQWRAAVASALGFVPEDGANERLRWREFQERRGRAAPLSDLPRGNVTTADSTAWSAFTAVQSRARRLWQEFLDGRYGRLARLNAAHQSEWASFDQVSLFDRLPASGPARKDWHDFETLLLPLDANAHRFTVLLPVRSIGADTVALARDRELARRIVELEKPAHTVFDVRFYFAMNRIGEARLDFNTTLGSGSRGPEMLPPAILGRAYLGESFIGADGPPDTDGRGRLAC